MQCGGHFVALIQLGKSEVAAYGFSGGVTGDLLKLWINVFDYSMAVRNDHGYRTLLHSAGKDAHALFGSATLPAYFCFAQLSFDGGNQPRKRGFIHEVMGALLK